MTIKLDNSIFFFFSFNKVYIKFIVFHNAFELKREKLAFLDSANMSFFPTWKKFGAHFFNRLLGKITPRFFEIFHLDLKTSVNLFNLHRLVLWNDNILNFKQSSKFVKSLHLLSGAFLWPILIKKFKIRFFDAKSAGLIFFRKKV